VAAGATLDAAGEAATEEEDCVVEFPIAAAWKAANLSPGLIAKTMPFWQWPVWRQYTQTGLPSATVNCACWKGPAVLLSGTGILPGRNQNTSRTQEQKGNLQASVEATSSGSTWASEGGLCRRVILLHEDKGDGIADVGSLVINPWSRTSRREIS
jgi:hypothetical protein